MCIPRSTGRPSLTPEQFFEVRPRALPLLQRGVDAADLRLIVRERALVAGVEEVEQRERALGVSGAGVFEPGQDDGTELDTSGRVLPFGLFELRDRLAAGVAEPHVVLGGGRILSSERVDERAFALVVSGAASCLGRRVASSRSSRGRSLSE